MTKSLIKSTNILLILKDKK